MPLQLPDLPPELLYTILDHLPLPSHLSLKLTSNRLYHTIPLPSTNTLSPLLKTLSPCERQLLRRTIYEPRDRAEGKRWCVVCSMLQTSTFFLSEDSPICRWHESWMMKVAVPFGVLERGVLRRLERFAGERRRRAVVEAGKVAAAPLPFSSSSGYDCDCDDGDDTSVKARALVGGEGLGPRWIRLRRQLCGQCLRINFWDSSVREPEREVSAGEWENWSEAMEGEDELDLLKRRGACRCSCSGCGVFNVDCFVRLTGPRKVDYPRAWEWPRMEVGVDGKERFVVSELHRGHGDGPKALYCKKIPVLDYKDIREAYP